jgi:hypothetical protein
VDLIRIDPTGHYVNRGADQATLLQACGYLPLFMVPHDPRSAKDQLTESYGFGELLPAPPGLKFNPETQTMTYPGDPEMYPFALLKLRKEKVYIYPHAWVCIVQEDGSYFTTRMD